VDGIRPRRRTTGFSPQGAISIARLPVVKGLAIILGARWGGYTHQESGRVGVGMISRGEVGLIVALVGVEAGLIKTELFSVVTLLFLLCWAMISIWMG
jgi:Kef-type K+ transport system membrane component KefB